MLSPAALHFTLPLTLHVCPHCGRGCSVVVVFANMSAAFSRNGGEGVASAATPTISRKPEAGVLLDRGIAKVGETEVADKDRAPSP